MEISILKTIIFGIVEGLTEFIPVSSTAHLLITRNLLGIPVNPLTNTFIVAIQSGAILAALWYFWKILKKDKNIFFKIACAFIPTAVFGLLFTKVIHSFFEKNIIIAAALIIGGIIFIFLPKKEVPEEHLSWGTALLLGLFQIAAFVPGMSRSGSLLIGGTLLGKNRRQITEFSFLLALPTIFGATAVDLWQNKAVLHANALLPIIIGAAVACVVALYTMRFFLKFIEQPNILKVFGWYRIFIGLAMLVFFLV